MFLVSDVGFYTGDDAISPAAVVSPAPSSAGMEPLSQGQPPAFGMRPTGLQAGHLVPTGAGPRPGVNKYGLAKNQKAAVFGQSGLPASKCHGCSGNLSVNNVAKIAFIYNLKHSLK